MDASPTVSPFAALTHRDFRFYVGARFMATMGVQMQTVAVGFQVYGLTHRTIDLAYVGLTQFLPVISLAILAGQVADRVDRRLILFGCDLVFAACAGGLYVIGRDSSPSLQAIFAVLVVLGAERAFYAPAGTAFLPALVPRHHLLNAVTWQSILWQGAAIVGPSVGGVVYGFAGRAGPVYLLAGALFVVAAILIAGIRTRPEVLDRQPATLGTALAGIRYLIAHKMLLGCMSLDFFAVFLGGATALLPIYASDILHVGAYGLGLMRAAPAIGAGLMAILLAFRPLGRRAGPKMLAAVGAFGAATIVFGLSRSFPLTLSALGVLGAADMISMVVRATLVQAATPASMRGRVSAVNQMFIGASNELGEFESGLVAAWCGVVPAVVLGGVGTLLVVALWAVGFPAIRQVDRLTDVKAEGEPA